MAITAIFLNMVMNGRVMFKVLPKKIIMHFNQGTNNLDDTVECNSFSISNFNNRTVTNDWKVICNSGTWWSNWGCQVVNTNNCCYIFKNRKPCVNVDYYYKQPLVSKFELIFAHCKLKHNALLWHVVNITNAVHKYIKVEALPCTSEDRHGDCTWAYIRSIGEYMELNRFSDLLNVYTCSYR